jgi:hypothetical protein
MRRLWLFGLGLVALGAAGGAAGCFSPDKPSCAFSCAEPPHTCPTGFVCGADNLCHDPTSAAACRITFSDAASDTAQDATDGADSADAVDASRPDSLPGG